MTADTNLLGGRAALRIVYPLVSAESAARAREPRSAGERPLIARWDFVEQRRDALDFIAHDDPVGPQYPELHPE
jgi:hypothetical protein